MFHLETASLRQGIRVAQTEEEVREIGVRLEEVKNELYILQCRVNVVEAQIMEREY